MTRNSNASCETHFDVVVLGGGAAGLFAAFTAAQRGRRVVVLERANKIGKKILMSGGGRCNFTNLFIEAQNFLSANTHFCKSALSQYTQWDFIALMEQHGLAYEERKHGQLFCQNSAKDLLTILEEECQLSGVSLRTRCDITGIACAQTENSRYQVSCDTPSGLQQLGCNSVIVATGALSVPTLGGSDRGYTLAQDFDLALEERSAGLVPFVFSDSTLILCSTLAGCSTPVQIHCGGSSFTEDMLFTHRGLSGPAVLQISNYWYPGDTLTIDLLPHLVAADFLLEQKKDNSKKRLRSALAQHLPKALVAALEPLWWADIAERPLAECNDAALRELGSRLNAWQLKPSATEGYRTAEVTRGGVATAGVSSKTMEVKDQPGLFFVGEVLDVTGHLGGFNFQWAWSSGYVAGINA